MDIKWQLNIGDCITDKERNLTIIGRSVEKKKRKSKQSPKGYVFCNIKWYKYKCNKCGYDEGYIDEKNLLNLHQGCSCCSGKTTIVGINDIMTTRPDLVKYFVNKADCNKYRQGSGKKVWFKCPDCGAEKKIAIFQVARQGFSCSFCSDGISYPEKFFRELLRQLKIPFVNQLSKSDFEWCGKYRYDIYLPDSNTIIELHGGQHYRGRLYETSYTKQRETDTAKKQLALNNGISRYITLDCSISECNYIKKSIMESGIPILLDFNESDVDWIECCEKAAKSVIYDVCKYWNKNKEWTTIDVAKKLNISRHSVIRYLKKGSVIGLCKYNPKNEMSKQCSKNGRSLGHKLEVFKDNISFGKFSSMSELERKSIGVFGVKFHLSRICETIKNNDLYHGYNIRKIN